MIKPGRWWPYVALGVGLVLLMPSLVSGLQLDDYYHWGLLTGHQLALAGEAPASLFALFSFIDGDETRTRELMDLGMLPWWTLPTLKYAFWRPVAELTHGLDYWLWPHQPWLMHLHSLFYLLLFYLAAYKLLARWLQASSLRWAMWIFCLSYTHGFAAGWLANRNALLASLFTVLTLYCHDRWRGSEGKNPLWHGLGLCCLALALLSGELGVSAGLLLLAYALTLEVRATLWARLLTISRYGLLGITWLITRQALGYGASGSGHYVSPEQPLAFLSSLAERWLALAAGLLPGLPPELGLGHWVMLLALIALTLLVILLLRLGLFQQPWNRFFALALVFSLLPLCATAPHSRLLMIASLPMAALLGGVLTALVSSSSPPGLSPLPKWLSGFTAALLITLLLVVSPVLKGLEALMMKLMMDASLNRGALAMQIADDAQAQQHIHVLLNPPSSAIAGYVQGVRAYHNKALAKAVLPLSSAPTPVRFERLDSIHFRLSNPQGLYLAQENLLRSSQLPLQVGEQIALSSMSIQVEAINKQGLPSQIQVELIQPLDNYVFHWWHGGQPVACQLPAPGGSIEVKPTSDCPGKSPS